VPLALSSELRTALRVHFRLLVNTPVHHDALFALLSGLSAAPALPSRPPAHLALRVLLVEDNPVNQRLMHKVLTNFGCTWTVAENGRRAVDELIRAEGAYDVVLMDLHMPEMDGIAALAEIRAGRAGLRAKTVWIAALTADARDDQRERAFAAGANDYLTKPLKLHDLEAALGRFREARKGRK
jgi:CheY-like chemotaxis protein